MFDRVFSAYQIGESWESRGRTVTESDLVMFAAFSGDWHPLHTDREWAQKGPFGQRIAHGMLTLSLATGLMVFKPGIVLAFYGIDRVRFVKPTYIQDTLRVHLKLIEKEEKSSGGVLTCAMTIIKQTGDPVVQATIKILVAKEL
ncbi:MAG: MaoC family dehydratase N-terminal domain-containing protein [Firmicutes bacterium]|jgi:acyl dehydratase|uniref:Dehydratase n=1 Tax=Sulfobacillus benefaciens TaxID=453960 RepID=A0A2T2WTQ6_9FIRM|nr:MaoC family dehydratase N-terminal domain-containing protein [Bacillota bacterium]MCL5014182.1 MaoC family dehydratase N-terminal domain-containing protein [Bacillota bacterium]PSR25620.1 MAG: dehydratase [Sulfobacillus benefaciens]HBQ96660.1 dehydratase [Sulfobacillus sp.]